MKKITLFLFALISGTAFAQVAEEASTFAEIVEPLSITKNQDLDFGLIIGGSAGGGTVSVSTDGNSTRTIPDALNAQGGTVSAAEFSITASDHSYSIGLNGTNLEDVNGNSMVYTPTNNLGEAAVGNQTLIVGGDLTVGTNQVAGKYKGTVTVTIKYE